MRLFLVLLLLTGSFSRVTGQSVFELEYRLPGSRGGMASALLAYREDGSGFIRTAWYDTRHTEKNITDLELVPESMPELPLKKYPVFTRCRATPFRQVQGNTAFPIDTFTLWLVNEGSGLRPFSGKPPGHEIKALRKSSLLGFAGRLNILRQHAVTAAHLTPQLFFKYFTSEEEMYPFPLTAAQLLSIRDKYTVTLHCITVTDTTDPKIAATTIIDRDNVDAALSLAAGYIRIKYNQVRLEGADFSRTKLDSVIRSLQVRKNDVIVLSYSGHGFSYSNDPDHPYPELALWHGPQNAAFFRANSINLETVFDAIRARGARLTIVIGDCCNTDAGINREIDSSIQPFPVIVVPPLLLRRNNMRLLVEAKGAYIACAAKKGQPAAGHIGTGGFFTYYIVEHLEDKSYATEDFSAQGVWDEIFREAGKAAETRAATVHCRELNGPCRQEMLFRNVAATGTAALQPAAKK